MKQTQSIIHQNNNAAILELGSRDRGWDIASWQVRRANQRMAAHTATEQWAALPL